jgi:hypothetical protein
MLSAHKASPLAFYHSASFAYLVPLQQYLFMKRIVLAALILLSSFSSGYAAPGDTTWVQAHYNQWLDWYGNKDTTVTFPSGTTSYRKIIMVFTLGKYICPGTPQYCSDWDYTVQNFLMTPGGDTLELGRLITPYARSARMGTNWKGVYMYDVTDLYPVLKNSATVRVHYSGYSGGFTANVKFAFIEGTPPRNVVGIQRVWKGSYNYGHGSMPINTALGNVSFTAPAGTVTAENKFTVTGHGADNQGCSEFCPNKYTMNLNNAFLVEQDFWRSNCGFNNYYPQNGTWIYDRGGWCPGDKVGDFHHVLPGVTANSNYTLNVTFPPHTSSGGSGASYTIESAVFYYGALNKTLDASLDDIIAPTDFEGHFRQNPFVGNPIIRVKNTGSTAITSLKIQYGVGSGFMPDHTWTGTIAPFEEKDITLPEPWSLRTATGINTFTAKILEVNGGADNDATNNQLTSTFKAAPKWPVTLWIYMKTNNDINSAGFSENNWTIYDLNNNIVAQRTNNAPNTIYADTFLLGPATYRLVVSDEGCDGMNWWANPGGGTGLFYLRQMINSIPLPLTGYYNGDFGCGFTQYFTTDWTTGVETVTANTPATIEAYPNPASNIVTVTILGAGTISGDLQVIDALGRVVLTQPCNSGSEQINIAKLANGAYSVVYKDRNGKIQTRLMIAK